MPTIREMPELTTTLHTQSMSDNDLASKDASQSVNPGLVRDHIFKQLGVNYQWSEVVLDQHLDSKKVNIGNKVYMPCPQSRTRAPSRRADNDNDLLTAFAHTALVNSTSTRDILHALGKYKKDGDHLVDLYLVLPQNAPDGRLGRVVGYESGAR
ncbi:hypothetical protein BS47DRAFT_1355829 [Hydnum rufescens UP504]|uniref:Uncharacterized protein n=1 Tax=Hydnum rufescens UP504 TaxID=1448309 RepID=A0A9P6ADB7_9AGAM|nr:hypothetical protein BS47DRAFT_1355829 [Hydnum rufescens UP504]